jgi:rhamnosyltransferase
MNFVLNNIFKGFKIGQKLIFPVGDMFWAKIKAIHQIFNIKFKNLFPKEKGQINQTIMHAIERIWLYLVKKNGYYYKIIFNHY